MQWIHLGETNTMENVVSSQTSVWSQQTRKRLLTQKQTRRNGHHLCRFILYYWQLQYFRLCMLFQQPKLFFFFCFCFFFLKGFNSMCWLLHPDVTFLNITWLTCEFVCLLVMGKHHVDSGHIWVQSAANFHLFKICLNCPKTGEPC